mmetsp:Transcript_14701/g.23896  ORF Transcript_14701/g.23896 Transcript_14701/m.23896 type:complete len:245 (+) Transcript_14701:246-980(+)
MMIRWLATRLMVTTRMFFLAKNQVTTTTRNSLLKRTTSRFYCLQRVKNPVPNVPRGHSGRAAALHWPGGLLPPCPAPRPAGAGGPPAPPDRLRGERPPSLGLPPGERPDRQPAEGGGAGRRRRPGRPGRGGGGGGGLPAARVLHARGGPLRAPRAAQGAQPALRPGGHAAGRPGRAGRHRARGRARGHAAGPRLPGVLPPAGGGRRRRPGGGAAAGGGGAQPGRAGRAHPEGDGPAGGRRAAAV